MEPIILVTHGVSRDQALSDALNESLRRAALKQEAEFLAASPASAPLGLFGNSPVIVEQS